MKRKVVFISVFLLSLIFLSLVCASEEEQVKKAYTCLEDKINETNCSTSFSFEDQIFSLLATGDSDCKKEVMSQNLSNQCWPNSGCTIKSTSQSILALREKNVNTTKAEEWLLNQKITPTDMDWFLEIESLDPTSCTITYSGSSYTISIAENKKISSNAGSSLTLAQDGYWLKISPSIYNTNIDVSCEKSFITTLLFKKKDSSTIQVSETVHTASAKGRTTEKVNSFCFSQGGVCDYEGSLWATTVLYYLNHEVSEFTPYLITMMDEESNQRYIPESFLYYITGSFESELLLKQKAGSYWEESGDKYYDTALALWPLYYESPLEKDSSKSWILGVQQNTGCWNGGNIRDTAFILYSMWPKDSLGTSEKCSSVSDCTEKDCMEASCDYGMCFYDYVSCIDGDGCCNPGCNSGNDEDCYGKECDSNSDCDVYLSESDEFCSSDNTQVIEELYDWTCGDEGYCIKEEISSEVIENCSENEECYAGNCLGTGIGGDECDSNFDCALDEICINGYCSSNLDCVDSGYFCMSQINCEGEILSNYACTGIYKCCDTAISLNTCSDEGGIICASDESCVGGTTIDVSNTAFSEVCCVGGECEEDSGGGTSTDCEDNGGSCRYTCWDGEEEDYDYVCGYGESCCIEKSGSSGGSLWWIWILLILILLSAVAIVFRDKLMTLWLKFKNLIGKNKDKRKLGMPFMPSPGSTGRILPRRILPSSSKTPIRRPSSLQHHPQVSKKPEEKPKNELDDVLKKLKEMGK